MSESLDQRIKFVEKDIIYVLRLILAFILIIIGITGLIFPIIPDWQLIIVGIIILDTRGVTRRKIISYLPRRYQEKAHRILFFKFSRKKVK